ncbi:hypothetical protein DICVIV_12797 [Dictyocaulus viviparus]|uniref:rRNA biogenesis protein RRP36 n=1 Tax=Dictyocaulus viviparus TaxID=29172 RepID=A0A0D8XC57_DICVI|nr:hypothetical protein DICVIV_12797 [Dictyocaulus viviparus]
MKSRSCSELSMDLPERDVDNVETEQAQDDPAITAFRAELAELPLCKVREVKEKLGLKLFNKAYFGTNASIKNDQSTRQGLEKKPSQYRGQHRPKEITSKKPVSTFRPVYQNINNTKKRRDPRFDARSGLFKQRCFEDNYSFLNDLRKQEIKDLTDEAANCEKSGDVETAMKIREKIRRFNDREKTNAERKIKQETYRQLREENIRRMTQGERPIFETRAKVRMMNMERKFIQLKKEKRLDQYMRRKSKKQANREAKRKPSFEEKYGYQ